MRMTLDLHGLKEDEAAARLRIAVGKCRSRGIGELQVIHGRGSHGAINGKPVLMRQVRKQFESELAAEVKSFRYGLPREGGEGVTVAYIAGKS